jgi:hypothetical protein
MNRWPSKTLGLLLLLIWPLWNTNVIAENASADAVTQTSTDISACLQAVKSIQPGQTRLQVERKFKEDGGLQTPATTRYLVPGCRDASQGRYVKVVVSYDLVDAQRRADQGDKVVSVGNPMLEQEISD